MTAGTVDYAASYFKYKSPTPIIGAPTNKTLKRLKQELRANASSVESNLGGGNNGYLGLVLDDTKYATLLQTAFAAPNYPDALTIPNGTSQIAALNLRERYKEDKRIYLECKNVEKAFAEARSRRHRRQVLRDSGRRGYTDNYGRHPHCAPISFQHLREDSFQGS